MNRFDTTTERLSNIERAQQTLRDSIEETKRLTRNSEILLDKSRRPADGECGSPSGS
jgi:hypothetical protein